MKTHTGKNHVKIIEPSIDIVFKHKTIDEYRVMVPSNHETIDEYQVIRAC